MSWARFFRCSVPILGRFQLNLRPPTRNLNANRANITKTGRPLYLRTYPTTVVLQDGSTINIEYKEPRRIIKLPVDLSTLSEEERQKRIDRRKPKKKVKVVEEVEDSFDVSSYQHLWKK